MEELNQRVNITPDKLETMKCEKCGCTFFKEVYVVKTVNKLLVGAQEDQILPVNVLVCDKCGHINEIFKKNIPGGMPDENKSSILV